MRGLSIEFKVWPYALGRQNAVAGCATMTCGCRVRHTVPFPQPAIVDRPVVEGRAKLSVIRALEEAAKVHDHDLHVKQQVLRRVTRRLKS